MGGAAALLAVARQALPFKAVVTFGAPLDLRALEPVMNLEGVAGKIMA